MTSKITKKDYIKILKFYNISIPKKGNILRKKAENILSNKLCKCIKKFKGKSEARAIGICTKSIINNKGFTRGRFRCKKKQNITLKHNLK